MAATTAFVRAAGWRSTRTPTARSQPRRWGHRRAEPSATSTRWPTPLGPAPNRPQPAPAPAPPPKHMPRHRHPHPHPNRRLRPHRRLHRERLLLRRQAHDAGGRTTRSCGRRRGPDVQRRLSPRRGVPAVPAARPLETRSELVPALRDGRAHAVGGTAEMEGARGGAAARCGAVARGTRGGAGEARRMSGR